MNDELDTPQSVEVLDPPTKARPNITDRAPSTRPPQWPQPAHRSALADNDEDSEDDNFIGRHRLALTVAAIVAVGGTTAWLIAQPKREASRKAPERMVMIQAVPPPPLPPPPPPPPKLEPPPPQEDKMIEQTPVEKEPEPEPEPADEPPPLGTNIKGDGPGDRFGLSSSGNGAGRIGGNSSGSGARSRWGWYTGKVQNQVADALRRHPKARTANIIGLRVHIWPDTLGRISRAELVGSTGTPALDAAIRNEVFAGLQLSEPPPAGMPSPIVLRVNLRRP